jgi:hypothetical protein
VSPTYAREPAFARDFAKFADEQQRRFLAAVAAMVGDMKAGRAFRPGLRVKAVQGWPGVGDGVGPEGRRLEQLRRLAAERHMTPSARSCVRSSRALVCG